MAYDTILLRYGEIFLKGKVSLGMTRFTAILWMIRNAPKLVKKRLAVRAAVNKKGEENMLSLFSNRAMLGSFLSFVKAK